MAKTEALDLKRKQPGSDGLTPEEKQRRLMADSWERAGSILDKYDVKPKVKTVSVDEGEELFNFDN